MDNLMQIGMDHTLLAFIRSSGLSPAEVAEAIVEYKARKSEEYARQARVEEKTQMIMGFIQESLDKCMKR